MHWSLKNYTSAYLKPTLFLKSNNKEKLASHSEMRLCCLTAYRVLVWLGSKLNDRYIGRVFAQFFPDGLLLTGCSKTWCSSDKEKSRTILDLRRVIDEKVRYCWRTSVELKFMPNVCRSVPSCFFLYNSNHFIRNYHCCLIVSFLFIIIALFDLKSYSSLFYKLL